MTSNINQDELRKLAEALPQGEWTVSCTEIGSGPDARPIAFLECDDSPVLLDEYPEALERISAPLETAAYLFNTLPTILSQADELARLRKALEAGVRVVKLLTPAQIAEGVHAGLRKGSGASDSSDLWKAISKSETTAWNDACEFAVDPFFSMWGGAEFLRDAAAVLSPLHADREVSHDEG